MDLEIFEQSLRCLADESLALTHDSSWVSSPATPIFPSSPQTSFDHQVYTQFTNSYLQLLIVKIFNVIIYTGRCMGHQTGTSRCCRQQRTFARNTGADDEGDSGR